MKTVNQYVQQKLTLLTTNICPENMPRCILSRDTESTQGRPQVTYRRTDLISTQHGCHLGCRNDTAQ
jgi:hypothetical protein